MKLWKLLLPFLLLPSLSWGQELGLEPRAGIGNLMSVSTQTTTQNSVDFQVPDGTTGLIIRVEVVAGAAISLDISTQIKWLNDAEYETIKLCGLTITGAGEAVCHMSPFTVVATPFPNAAFKTSVIAPIPRNMRIQIVHGNANAASYFVSVFFLR